MHVRTSKLEAICLFFPSSFCAGSLIMHTICTQPTASLCVRVSSVVVATNFLKNYTGRLIRLFMIIQHASDCAIMQKSKQHIYILKLVIHFNLIVLHVSHHNDGVKLD